MNTVIKIQNAVIANCAVDKEYKTSKYKTRKNLDHPYMAQALTTYFMLSNGYTVEDVKLELSIDDTLFASISGWMSKRRSREDEKRWNIKKQLIENYLKHNQ